ncbi:MAG: hypothetical protein WCF85_07155 [Rhodospirillaceae bacterium]
MAAISSDEMRAAVEAVRRDLQTQIDALKAELAALKAQPALPGVEEVGPETLVILAAAVTAFLGKKVRIRSARQILTPHEGASPWAQHGRVFVQAASHDMRRVR